MSSESDCEEFFDAFDITPSRIESTCEDDSKARTDTKISPALTLLQKEELAYLKDTFNSKETQTSLHKVSHKSPWRSRTTSPLPDPMSLQPSLSSKLTSSLPTLHLQEGACSQLHSQSSAQSILMNLEKPFNKEDVASVLMPPPKDIPIKNEAVEISKREAEEQETSSACSGSLLDTLGAVEEEDEAQAQFRWRGRRARHRKVKLQQDEDDEGCPHPQTSPGGSQSSSIDSFFPSSQTSAPFRVVEMDATSIYSTTFSQDKGTKLSLKLEEKEEEVVSEQISSDKNLVRDEVETTEHEQQNNDDVVPLSPEPDVVASTKSNSLPRSDLPPTLQPSTSSSPRKSEEETIATDSSALPSSPKIIVQPPPPPPLPVAPPRKNKKRKKRDDDCQSVSSVTSLPTPSFSMALKDADVISHHLDLQAASKGDYIVCHQDTEKSKAPGPFDWGIIRTESTGDTTSQASTPETARASYRSTPSAEKSPEAHKLSSASTSSHNTPSNDSVSSGIVPSEGITVSAQLPATGNKPEIPGLTDEVFNEEGRRFRSDEEILQQVSVLNLDTGERIPLSEAEECLPPALNPLSLHIMRLTSEYNGPKSDQDDEESDEDSIADVNVRKLPEIDTLVVKKKTLQLKKFLGKTMESAVNKAKTLAQEVSHRNKEEKDVFEDDAPAQNTMQYVKIKTSHSHKGPHEFDNLMYVQELKGEHTGPVWCMKFSPCGRLLATAGQDHILRVWVLKQAFNYFLDIRTKWNADVKSSPTPSQESLVSQHSSHSSEDLGTLDPTDDGLAPFMPKPFCVYSGHTADVLDLSWSKNYFMLTSSMDKTVRLWHISRKECLCIFKHVDFVTAIAFHPKDDRYFISGSLDGKLRLWSIPDKQVVMWNEVEGHPKLITAANFCQNGIFTVVGTYNGRCIFYKTEELKYFTQIHVKSTRGKNARGRKITGIEPLPEKDMLLITSNDSRIRLYDLNVLNVACKYKGYSNVSSQIKAGFSHDGKYIIAGSENQCIYIWKTHHDYSKFSSARKDRNIYWEGVKAHSAVVTCAIFSPKPEHVFSFIEQQEALNKAKMEETKEGNSVGGPSATTNGASKETSGSNKGYVLVSADFNGCIKVFLKKEKPKHSSLPASALA